MHKNIKPTVIEQTSISLRHDVFILPFLLSSKLQMEDPQRVYELSS